MKVCVCGSHGKDWSLCACVQCQNVCSVLAYSYGFTLSGRWLVHLKHEQFRLDRSEVSGIDFVSASF